MKSYKDPLWWIRALGWALIIRAVGPVLHWWTVAFVAGLIIVLATTHVEIEEIITRKTAQARGNRERRD